MPLVNTSSIPTRKNSPRYHTKVEAGQLSYFWTIDNFKLCRKRFGEKLKSQSFNVETTNMETKWRLELFPNGEQKKDEGNLSVVLILLDPNHVEIVVNFTFSIMNVAGKRTNIKKWNDIKFFGLGDLGFVRFMKLDELMSKASDLLPDGKLTICCDLSVIVNPTTKISGPSDRIDLKSEGRVCDDLRSLLKSETFSDVTLIVNDKKFCAHKVILAARSPVFAATFQNDMQENKDNIVNITDVETEAFENVLIYIYSGKTPTLKNNHQVQDILYVANKYRLDKLKTMCELALSKILTDSTAAEILLTADLHDANILKDSATQYILSYPEEVIATEGWRSLEDSHPQIAIKIFRAITKRIRRK